MLVNTHLEEDTWLTPEVFYNNLGELLFPGKGFSAFDPCPPKAKIDGLSLSWSDRTFCNPPYSRNLKDDFILKAHHESLSGKRIVLLLPANTDTKMFAETILPQSKVIWIQGRLKFEGIRTEKSGSRFHMNPGVGRTEYKGVLSKGLPTQTGGGTRPLMVACFDRYGTLGKLPLAINTEARVLSWIT